MPCGCCSAARSDAGDSTPELAADAKQMREEIASLKNMWQKLETVADGAEGGGGSPAGGAATGPDEDDYW